MTKNKNTDLEATAIFAKIPLMVSKNKGFIIIKFFNGERIIGIYKNASQHTSNSLSTSSLPNRGTLELADALGNVTAYDIYSIRELD